MAIGGHGSGCHKPHGIASRLCQLHDGLAEIVHSYKPDEDAVEQTFVNKDAVETLKLGQARGIAMLVPARAGLP
ncbi:crossover junction endodeoxyribonuclease RuvC, partial [Rhizobium leguminosarum]|uniref:crossover junction endodeoxyribonuclease RuvC n=1 Tax=Rhizobium leguminosarum TaxID=384 RepID=UPI003F98077C